MPNEYIKARSAPNLGFEILGFLPEARKSKAKALMLSEVWSQANWPKDRSQITEPEDENKSPKTQPNPKIQAK